MIPDTHLSYHTNIFSNSYIYNKRHNNEFNKQPQKICSNFLSYAYLTVQVSSISFIE